MFDGAIPMPECDACEQPCFAHLLVPAETGRMICPTCKVAEDAPMCAYCGKPHGYQGEAEYSLHRDGFSIGPQVPLCKRCAGPRGPTCPQIWAKISQRPS